MVFFFQILCVLGLVSAGFFARRRGLLSAHGTNDLAHLALSIVYPALIFVSILELSFADLRANLTLPLLVMAIAMVGFGLVRRAFSIAMRGGSSSGGSASSAPRKSLSRP